MSCRPLMPATEDFDSCAARCAELCASTFDFIARTAPDAQRGRDHRSCCARWARPSPADELNCGSCGYNTCREKAIAVYQGKAEISMCLPYPEGEGRELLRQHHQQHPQRHHCAQRELGGAADQHAPRCKMMNIRSRLRCAGRPGGAHPRPQAISQTCCNTGTQHPRSSGLIWPNIRNMWSRPSFTTRSTTC